MKDIIDVLKSVLAQIKSLPTRRRAKVLAAGLVIAALLLIGGGIGGIIAVQNAKDSEMAQTLARVQQAHQAEQAAKQAQITSLESDVARLQTQIALTPVTLTPTPTHTPSPTPTSTPTPTNTLTPTTTPTPIPTPFVQAKITSPMDGQKASVNPEVVAEYRNVPADRHLWIAVRIPHVRPTGLIYPQLKEMQLPPRLTGAGIYKTYVALGASADVGKSFNIIALLADDEANQLIVAYAKACSFNVNSCTGMPLPETGIEILDFVTVIRQ